MILVNGESMEWRQGMTVREILNAKRYAFPVIAVQLNGKYIRRDQFNDTEVPDEANVEVIHMIGGG